jgi:LysM repeat protein
MSTSPHQRPLQRWLARGLFIFLAIAVVFSVLPPRASAATLAKPECDYTYEVKRGDTLANIGDYFGIGANQIVYANEWKRPPYTIYVGQSICIPDTTKSGLAKLASKYANAQAVFFTAGRADKDILVYTYNYPKTTVLVKVDNASDPARKFYTLGTINIASVGNKKALRLRLPTELQNASQLYICLKDKKTSYLQCVYPR